MEKIFSKKFKKIKCPYCKKRLDGITGFKGTKPEKDDISYCVYCNNILVFTDKLALRKPTKSELIEIANDKAVNLLSRLMKEVIKKH